MIQIFAKYGTDEKVSIVCDRNETRIMMDLLSIRYGGEWLWVDTIKGNEFLKFNDGLEYKGFHGREERYCNAIQQPL